MPTPAKNVPSPETYQETLAYLTAAYQQVYAEREVLHNELLSLRRIETAAACSASAELASGPISTHELTTSNLDIGSEDQAPAVNLLEVTSHTTRTVAETAMRLEAKADKRLVEQYSRLQAASVEGLTAHDLVVTGTQYNSSLDMHHALPALVRFKDFCIFGPEHTHFQKPHVTMDMDDWNENARSLEVPYFVFARLAGSEELDSHQVLQDVCACLLQLRDGLTRESAQHKEIQERSLNNAVEAIAAFAIFLSAIFLGVTTNHTSKGLDTLAPGWVTVELFFTVFFLAEVVFKITRNGMYYFFCGPSCLWNVFDLSFVVVSIMDSCVMIIQLAGKNSEQVAHTSWKIFRLARLIRIARLTRLLRFQIFSELRAMVEGLFSGLRVLFWAVVLLVVFIYVLALVIMLIIDNNEYQMNDGIFDKEEKLVQDQFKTVLWSMFSLFRCFTDGCSATDGTPLHVHMARMFGKPFIFVYALFYLFVTIGIFNLIMAIFLDNVMDSSNKRRQREREHNAAEMERRLRQIICNLSQHQSSRSLPSYGIISAMMCCSCRAERFRKRRQQTQELDPNLAVTRPVFNMWLNDHYLLDLLDEMDIGTANRAGLFDVLDSDLSGKLEVHEIISGLMKLRGPAEKCDAIATLLSVKQITPMIEELHVRLTGMSAEDLQLQRADALRNEIILPSG